MNKLELQTDEFNAYFEIYVSQAADNDLVKGLEIGKNLTMQFIKSIPDNKFEYRYQEDKWTIKELVLHLIDSERMFAYRALAIARGEKQNLPGYDENVYAKNSLANNRSIESLLKEYETVRNATISLYKGFQEEVLLHKGNANDSIISVRALGFIISGHEAHHCKIIKQRYLD